MTLAARRTVRHQPATITRTGPRPGSRAAQLAAECDRQGLTVAQWAARAGLHLTTVYKYLADDRGGHQHTVDALAGALGLELCLRPRTPQPLPAIERTRP